MFCWIVNVWDIQWIESKVKAIDRRLYYTVFEPYSNQEQIIMHDYNYHQLCYTCFYFCSSQEQSLQLKSWLSVVSRISEKNVP